jgi:CsoR family transcriptional regulator, copper-sensing transcriptional repressor
LRGNFSRQGDVDEYTGSGYDPSMTTPDALTMNDRPGATEGEEMPLVDGQAALRTSTAYAHDKAKNMARLRRMEGQVRGVQRMVDEDQYCLDVLTQLSAIIAAARQTGLLVLEDHVRGCVLGAEHADEIDREELLTDLIGAIDRFGRSVG